MISNIKLSPILRGSYLNVMIWKPRFVNSTTLISFLYLCVKFWKSRKSRRNSPVGYYSKTVLGCKENRRYEMVVQKIVFRGRTRWLSKKLFSEVVDRGKGYPSSIDNFLATSHCFAIIIYLISPINRELMSIY